MNRIVRVSGSALQVAASLSGVPYVGAAATVLNEIARCCNDINIHKSRCQHLADKCAQVLLAIQEQDGSLDGGNIAGAVDELSAVFERIAGRVRQWSRYTRVKCFLKSAEIDAGLTKCEAELDTALQVFEINSSIVLHRWQTEASQFSRTDAAEMRDLLYQILQSQQEIRQIADMQQAGEDAARRIMTAGQRELRTLRQTGIKTDANRSADDSMSRAERFSEEAENLQHGLAQIHRLTGIPPSVKVLDGEVVKTDDMPIVGGTFTDVWRGVWLGTEKVALKAVRGIKAFDKAKRRFESEIEIWARLEHEHILPLYGIATNLGQHIHIVSPWQDNGDLLEYVKGQPKVNRLYLLWGAAKGTEYLHEHGVVHGNLKCSNILVSVEGRACICDFGMSKVIEEITSTPASTTLTAGCSARWLAPELIEGLIPSPTKETDVYSFAMAVLECCTLRRPFADRKRDATVIHDVVMLKSKPSRPEEEDASWLPDKVWELLEACWSYEPVGRPRMRTVTEVLGRVQDEFEFA
ncbi:TKL/TKL-ccin protein kinase [Neolentinus lepideus HHB14362 ss-1]|uniref:TKL/TKL-ccin protein kinase n=1 Tax=Neolentinus lepideus HHB14362 ss-1 TaxID=1314782 RepID=A0A165NXT3_9AGAM|nr:TKL/TKL-ccin protein kinase [Neolentinus lepideus HHB14362 ss-1]